MDKSRPPMGCTNEDRIQFYESVERRKNVYKLAVKVQFVFSLISLTLICTSLSFIHCYTTRTKALVETEMNNCEDSIVQSMKLIYAKQSWTDRANRTKRQYDSVETQLPQMNVMQDQCDGCCLPGPPGVRGNPGRPGLPGSAGAPGRAGRPGLTPNMSCPKVETITPPPCKPCPPGPPGIKGWPGFPGDPGMTGPMGKRGDDGEPGETGEPGMDGPEGYIGAPGEPGDKGITPDGKVEPGPPGDPGQPGPVGLPGLPGLPGRDGPVGPIGEPGWPGMEGEVGEQGYPGPEGPVGSEGVPGIPGTCVCKSQLDDLNLGEPSVMPGYGL